MGNLYRLNSLFEIEIGKYPETILINKGVLETSHAFEYLFLILSQEKDYTLFSEPASEELLEYWGNNKISHGRIYRIATPYFSKMISLDNKIIADSSLIEWGKTSYLNATKSILQKKDQTIFQSKFINSKLNQMKWKELLKINSLNSIICSNKFELEYALSCMTPPFVIKSEFSFSGRGNLILKSATDLKSFSNKIEEILKENPEGIIVEEWVEDNKILDFSGLFELSNRKSKFLAITKMLIDKSGTYRGSIVQRNFGENLAEGLQDIVNHTMRFNTSYTGPISIDGFTFRKNDKTEIQYMSEINYRYSMGRILYELHNKIGIENEDCALLFLPIKAKSLQFKSLISNLNKIGEEYNARILLLTPITGTNKKKMPFAIFYISSKDTFPLDSIKKLIS